MTVAADKIRGNRIGKIFTAAFVVSIFAVSICGCGKEKNTETKLSINKEGNITSVIFDEFGKDYYDLSELQDMAADEISYYNSEYDEPKITLEESELSEDGQVSLKMVYSNYIDYAHFNQVTFFYGTVAEATNKGFSVSGDLVGTDGRQIVLDEINDLNDRHIIITGDKTGIVAPYNISYTTKGVNVKDKKEADLSGVTVDVVQLLLSK